MDNKEKDFTEMTTEDLNKEVPEISKQFFQKLVQLICGQPVQIDNLDFKKLQEIFSDVLCTLSPRERDVLRLRLGMDDGKLRTFEEIGQLFGVKKEEIQLIEAGALRKLRHPNRRKELRKILEKN
jgi:RNA polymerase primary sigma factor